mmetsp:Transcript_15683/g.22836  ORF Transcript_15683/g.22836 Transcript_15683/m.22836 type:complete len:155 (-) Transcript_15683:227-691(-)
MMNNPTTAHICLNSLRVALKMGRMEMMPSFFFDLESPSVEAYKMRQNQVLESTKAKVPEPGLPLRSSVSRSARDFVTAPSSILKSTRREKNISQAMEKANRMSVQYKVSSFQAHAEVQKSPSGAAGGGKGEDKVEKGVPEKKKKKKFLKFIGGF